MGSGIYVSGSAAYLVFLSLSLFLCLLLEFLVDSLKSQLVIDHGSRMG